VTHEGTIESIVERAPGTKSVFLRLAVPLHFVPGQFISCLLPIDDPPAIRAYSIASDPEEPTRIEICLNLVRNGLGSRYLLSLGVGAKVRFTGPWGTFTLDRQPEAECVFIAEGTSIAPIRPMLHRPLRRGSAHALRLDYAAPSTAELLYADEFERAAREHPRFTFVPLLATSLVEFVTHRYLARDQNRSRHFYICGVGAVVLQLRDLLRRGGYERRAVQYEKW
jgi:ferredoxin-NADP reductase